MNARKIPSTGVLIPVVGMGTWQTFDVRLDDAQQLAPLREVFTTFHAAGERVIDSSPMYGRSEAVAGELSTQLKINAELFVATKVWTRGRDAGIRQMETSLRELRRERIELMQVHNLVDWQTQLKTLRQWKEAGRIKYIGITHYTPTAFEALEQIVRDEPLDFLQLPYSLAVRDAEQRLLPLAKDRGVATLINRPFEEGKLFQAIRGKELPTPIKAFADSWGEAFLKFILAHDAVTCVIPATSKPHHMADNVRAGFGRLPDAAERKALRDAIS